MDKSFKEQILRDFDYNVNKQNIDLIEKIFANKKNDIKYVFEKIPTLKDKIAHVKGYVALSSSKNTVKITFDNKNVSESISKEFYDIVVKWQEKYKIILSYDYEKEVFYVI